MTTSLRIPLLIDVTKVTDAAGLHMVARDRRWDRGFASKGPLINRIIARRARTVLSLDGRSLPSAAPRDNAVRQEKQQALARRLDRVAAQLPADPETLAQLARLVRGEAAERPLAVLTQEAVGRLFAPHYRADDASVRAAQVLDTVAQTRNPLRAFLLVATGKLKRAQRRLGRLVGGDAAGVHATGIAVHNLVRGFDRMRAIWADPALRARMSDNAVLAQCLVAPPTVLRQTTMKGACPLAAFRPGSLMLLALDQARSAVPDPATVFMAGSWSACPASTWVPALMRAVWAEAKATKVEAGGGEA